MKVIVGLGNFGTQYVNTRHNAGYEVLDLIAKDLKFEFTKSKFNAMIKKINYQGENVLFVKPLTYMNNSGEAVKAILDYYKISIDELLVIHDDLDLDIGKVRLRKEGTSAGQKGIQNIIDLLKSKEFKRIKIGIGKSDVIPVVDYVLGKFKGEEEKQFFDGIKKAKDAALLSIIKDFEYVSNRYSK